MTLQIRCNTQRTSPQRHNQDLSQHIELVTKLLAATFVPHRESAALDLQGGKLDFSKVLKYTILAPENLLLSNTTPFSCDRVQLQNIH